MKYIEKHINQTSQKTYYASQIEELSKEQRDGLEKLVEKLDASGSTNPLGWALSEVQENIAQFARFSMLKGLYEIVDDVDGNLALADDIDEVYDAEIFDVKETLRKVIGEDALNAFLKSFTKGVMWQVANLMDEGNSQEKNQPGWVLSELNTDGHFTDRSINGLHESFNGFEDEMIPKPT